MASAASGAGSRASGGFPPQMSLNSQALGSMASQAPSITVPPSPAGSAANIHHDPGTPGAAAQFAALTEDGLFTGKLQVRISKLMNMPREFKGGQPVGYVIHATDDGNRLLGQTLKLGGIAPADKQKETLDVTEEQGTIQLTTRSPVIRLLLYFDGGEQIGHCRVSRMDARSAKPNAYTWEDEFGNSKGCGVEVVLYEGVEDSSAMPPAPSAGPPESRGPTAQLARGRPEGFPPGAPPAGFPSGAPSPPGYMQPAFPSIDFGLDDTRSGRSVVPPPPRPSNNRPSPVPAAAPVAASQGPAVGQLAQECGLHVMRLLDVPCRPGVGYVVRALDSMGQLASTPEVRGSSHGQPIETVKLGSNGMMMLRTDSPHINLQVEYSDGTTIGLGHIYRPDPRSASLSAYMLTDASGNSAKCGIEVVVTEGRPEAKPAPTSGQRPSLEAGSRVVGRLRVKVIAAYGLLNRDTGLFGDVSDPFVEVTVGKTVHRTMTIDNNLNPIWTASNEFTFPITAEDGHAQIEVINSNVIKNDSLGSISVGFWSLPPGQPLRRRERLNNVDTGELEYEVLFEPMQVSHEVPPSVGKAPAAPPAAPKQPGRAACDAAGQPYGPCPGGLGPLAGLPAAGGFPGGPPPPGSLMAGGLYLPPLTAGWETSMVPREQGAMRSVPAPPQQQQQQHHHHKHQKHLAEHEVLFPDMFHYDVPKHEAHELWMKDPDPSAADLLLADDRDYEVLAATAEPWRAPVLALRDDDPFEDEVFPDMDVNILLERDGLKRSRWEVREDKTVKSRHRRDGLPDFPVDQFVAPKPKAKPKSPGRRHLKDKEEKPERQPLRQLKEEDCSALHENAGPRRPQATSVKNTSPIMEARNRRRQGKLKVERELVRPEQARDIEQQCSSPDMVSLDPALQPNDYEAQVISCLDASEEVGQERRVWVRTPSSEPAIMEVPENDQQWLDPFQSEELLVGVSSRRGKRGSMDPLPCQDSFSLTRFPEDNVLYLVCDGHGPFGHIASFRVAQSLPCLLGQLLEEQSDRPEAALVQAFERAAAELESFADLMGVDISSSGTSCSAAFRRGANVQVAWLGDSRAMVATVTTSTRKVDLVTPGHTTEDVKELQRVRDKGAKLVQVPPNVGAVRIFTPGERTPGLSITRALGDLSAQALGVTAQPDIRKMSFSRTPGLVLLASGGFWEMLDDRWGPGEETLRLLLSECRLRDAGPAAAASSLCTEAQRRWRQAADDFSDDVACVVLHWTKPGPAADVSQAQPVGAGLLPSTQAAAPRQQQEAGSLGSSEAADWERVVQMAADVKAKEAAVVQHQQGGSPLAAPGVATPSFSSAVPGPSPAGQPEVPLAVPAGVVGRLKPITLPDAAALGLEEVRRHCADPKLVHPDARLRPANFSLQLFGRIEAAAPGGERGGWLRMPADQGGEATLSPLDAGGVFQVLGNFQAGSAAKAAICCRQGQSTAMNQDNFSVTSAAGGIAIYVVTDGHGPLGHLAAFRTAQSIPKFVLESLSASEAAASAEKILAEAFQAAAAELVTFGATAGLDFASSGASAAAMLRQGDSVHVCWLGDSRVLVATIAGEFSRVDLMSQPHVPTEPAERKRLEQHGAELRPAGPDSLRIFSPGSGRPGLAISRALGNSAMSGLGVSSRPDLAKTSFASAPGLVLLGSGGLHEYMDQGEAVLETLLHKGQLGQRGAREALVRLCDDSKERWQAEASGSDDVTGLLLYWPGAGPEEQQQPHVQPQEQGQQPPPQATSQPSSLAARPASLAASVAVRAQAQAALAASDAAAASASTQGLHGSVRFLQAHPARPSSEGQKVAQASPRSAAQALTPPQPMLQPQQPQPLGQPAQVLVASSQPLPVPVAATGVASVTPTFMPASQASASAGGGVTAAGARPAAVIGGAACSTQAAPTGTPGFAPVAAAPRLGKRPPMSSFGQLSPVPEDGP